MYSNLCVQPHNLLAEAIGTIIVERCETCPYFRAADSELSDDGLMLPFDPLKVDTRVIAVSR